MDLDTFYVFLNCSRFIWEERELYNAARRGGMTYIEFISKYVF